MHTRMFSMFSFCREKGGNTNIFYRDAGSQTIYYTLIYGMVKIQEISWYKAAYHV